MQVALFCLFFIFCHAQVPSVRTFKANIAFTDPTMVGGSLQGFMVYDWNWPAPSYYTNFSAQSISTLYQFNPSRGVTNTKAQFAFKFGPGCPGGCETGTIRTSMPRFFYESATYHTNTGPTVNGCTRYVPTVQNSLEPVAELWLSSNGYPCSAKLTNGNSFVFSAVTPTVSVAERNTSFAPLYGCSCGKPFDVSIVMDRSTSISGTEHAQMMNFVTNFVKTFKVGPDQSQIALTWFGTVDHPVLPLTNNLNTILTSLSSSSFACQGSGTSSCLSNPAQYTSISAGLQRGAAQIAKTAPGYRSFATHLIVLLTDGTHNTLADSTSTKCYGANNNAPCATNAYAICGDNDRDGIPDEWETPSQNTCGTQCNYTTSYSCTNANQACTWSGMSTCQRDLINAREYAYKVVGEDLIIFAVGISSDPREVELRIITDNLYSIRADSSLAPCSGSPATVKDCVNKNYRPCTPSGVDSACLSNYPNPDRVIMNVSFADLNTILLELSARVCDVSATPCGACCGFCKCGTCTAPDNCTTTNFCDVPTRNGPCCSSTPRDCTSSNPCLIGTCDRNANNGAGGCTYTPYSCPASAQPNCFDRVCNPAKGFPPTCDDVFKGVPPTDSCRISECRPDGTLINNTLKNCTQSDPCFTYSCDTTKPASTSCVQTPLTLPNNPPCKQYRCNSSNPTNPLYLVDVVCPTSNDLCAPFVCNNVTGKCESDPIVCNNASNKCDLSTCVNGVCITDYRTCTTPNCKNNCTCDPNTGSCNCRDTLCSSLGCITRTCDVNSNICVNDSATCPESCLNNTCDQQSNQCYILKCIASASNITNCDGVTYTGGRCNITTDSCLVNCTCVNATGCRCDPVPCPPLPCKEVTRNSTAPGCCVYTDRVCSQDPCNTVRCVNSSDACTPTPNCPGSDLCYNRGCFPNNGSCWSTPIPCVPGDACKVPLTCDPATGCSFSSKNCDDGDNCTVDTCDPSNFTDPCKHTPVFCDDSDPCTIDQCSAATGTCTHALRTCNDNNMCTTDSCNSTNNNADPCVYTPIDVATLCNDNDLCTDDTCVPDKGCVNVAYNLTTYCPPPTDACSVTVCLPSYGCQSAARTCLINLTTGKAFEVSIEVSKSGNGNNGNGNSNGNNGNGKGNGDGANATDCSIAFCEVVTDQAAGYACVAVLQSCSDSIQAVVIIASLSTAAVVGIVIAVIIAIAACGGASAAVYNKLGDEVEAKVFNSPLYEGQSKGGANMLYDPNAGN